MKDSHCPWMLETLSLPEEMSAFITSDLSTVPAMMTVFAGELEDSVGPVKFSAGPTVYFGSARQLRRVES